MKIRLDKLLVERGLAPTRERAQALILAGRVLVSEQKSDKPGHSVDSDSPLRLLGSDLRYVSRGGLKLEAALAHWSIDLAGRFCLDVGASTGGFTDCMLQHGAARVLAVDTGYGQIAQSLRDDPRVSLMERTNARLLSPGDLPPGIAFLAMDVSFISATLVLPPLLAALRPRPEPESNARTASSAESSAAPADPASYQHLPSQPADNPGALKGQAFSRVLSGPADVALKGHGFSCAITACEKSGALARANQSSPSNDHALYQGTASAVPQGAQNSGALAPDNTPLHPSPEPTSNAPADVALKGHGFSRAITAREKSGALAPEGSLPLEAVILIKPQFEAGREHVGKGGIVRDPAAHQLAIDRVLACVRSLGGQSIDVIPSPITGAEGNREFLLHVVWRLKAP